MGDRKGSISSFMQACLGPGNLQDAHERLRTQLSLRTQALLYPIGLHTWYARGLISQQS